MTEPEERTEGPAPISEESTVGDFPEETLCASCGKFVGAYARCPYCGTKHGRRFSIRFFRGFALIVGLGGTLLIYLAARGIKAPLIKIADIGPTNSFAYVRVEGEDISTRIYEDGGVLFRIDDGTGTLMIRAYGDMGKKLLAQDRIPGPGDRVSVEGTLQLRENFVQMIVNVPTKVRIERVVPELTAIANLDDDYMDEKVLVEGKIVGERKFPKGSSFTVSDGTGTIDVTVWDSNLKMFGARKDLLELGKNVLIQGMLGKYRDKFQVGLAFPGDIEELDREVEVPDSLLSSIPGRGKGFQKLEIGSITLNNVNDYVEITGKVAGVRKFSKGTNLQILDPTGEIDVVVWDSLREDIPAADELLKDGKILTIKGLVGQYRNKLQVIPKSPSHVKPAE